jgi:alpha-mannosidase
MNVSKVCDPKISRRHFTLAGLLTTAYALLPTQLRAAAEARRVMHIIGHSHVDAAWLWPWPDAADVVMTTFRSALDRMNENPGFCYTQSSTLHYEWVLEADPGMFEEIRQRVREGRWEVVGGWPVEPDCNIPSTESFVRHCLYGKPYIEDLLNTRVDIGFNPDSFGHAAGLPTILKNAGYNYYVFMRPQEHEMNLPRLFWWEGPDGARVLTYRIYKYYDWGAEGIREASQNVFAPGMNDGAYYFGVGDHGGAVTREHVRELLALRSDSSLPELRWSTMRDYFSAVEKSPAFRDLPVIKGDLQHHARGCYSGRGQQKADNRRAEKEMYRAETVGTIAGISYGIPYRHAIYRDSWKQVTFNQFHDLLAGSALFSDYTNSRDGLGLACQNALWTRHPQLIAMARAVDMRDVPEGAIFAFNTLPWPREALLEFHYDKRETKRNINALKAKDGTLIPLQLRPSDSMANLYPRLSAWVELPACGYKVFTLERNAPVSSSGVPSTIHIQTDSFGVASFKPSGAPELLAGKVGLVVIEDKSDTWAHDVAAFRKELGRPTLTHSEVVEDGPVTRVTRQTLEWQNSRIGVEFAEFIGSDAIEMRFAIDWHEQEQMLKLEVPTRLNSPRLFAKVPGAVLERNTDGNEEPYSDWVALEGTSDETPCTLALLNAQTYSYDCLNGLLRSVLVRSAPYAQLAPHQVEHEGMNAWQDQGREERTFWLVGGKGGYRDLHLDRRAMELQSPAEYVLDSRHAGTQPWEQSFLTIIPAHVEVLAIKKGEQDNNVVVRVQERSGETTSARLTSSVLHLDTEVQLAPWEIKTLSISSTGAVNAVSVIER